MILAETGQPFQLKLDTALVKSRGADTLVYDKATNPFLVKGADGAQRTMFSPTDGINYWDKQ